MSLLLCRQEDVKHPYYAENLGIHLYSSQELSYVIYNYPLLVLDGFVGDGLLDFLRDELNHGFLALKLERWLKSNEDPDECLIMILQECDYYNSAEINRYRQQLAGIRKKHPAEYRKLKADEMFSMRQYGRAVRLYRELLDYPADAYVDEAFEGRIWNNLGSCYARMFQFEKAYEAYEKAYARNSQPQILEKLYCLTKLDERLKLGDRLQTLITEEMRQVWDADMEDARAQAEQADSLRQLDELFKRDPIKRQAGAAKLLHRLKQEYRAMV